MIFCTLCEQPKQIEDFGVCSGLRSARCKRCRALTPAKRRALVATKHEKDEIWLASYGTADGCPRSAPGNWPEDEKWVPVPGYLALYEVSDRGRVRSWWEHKRGQYWRRPSPKVLEHYSNRFGYRLVTLVDWCSGDKTTRTIHSLVVTAFFGPPPTAHHVCGHRDGNPSNNCLDNLRWITFVENEQDKRDHGRSIIGTKNHNAKLTDDGVVEMRRRRNAGEEFRKIAKDFNVSTVTAHRAITGMTWRHVQS